MADLIEHVVRNMMRKMSYIGRHFKRYVANSMQGNFSPLFKGSCHLMPIEGYGKDAIIFAHNHEPSTVVLFAQFMLTDVDLSLRYVRIH
uniref:Uncharacterized protein n=1 Tax=Oryza barthii TaxID=65489 RepID=A0A0D3GZJ3_9ORYZ